MPETQRAPEAARGGAPHSSQVELSPLSTHDYVRLVLPDTHALWGSRRDFETYAADFRATAESPYVKRRPFTMGLYAGGELGASCKLYDRELRWGPKSLRATGIGAVFTPPALRGRGYASALLGAVLDEERASGRDLAYLFSDIHPAFYERLTFRRLPSRVFTLRAASLDGSPAGATPIEEADWSLVRRCFDALEAPRPWTFKRTPLVWHWLRRRLEPPAEKGTQAVQLAIKQGRSIIAYVIGRRVLRDDAFVIDDFAFANDAGRARLPALLRAATGDLGRVAGWLPPPIAREALPRGSVRARKTAITMIAPLSSAGRAWWQAHGDEICSSRADPVWEADHV
jgi:GNAT superfamily N-acetyltransferase